MQLTVPPLLKTLLGSFWLKLALSLTLLYLVFRKIDLNQILITVSRVPLHVIFIFTLLWIAIYVLCAWRWSLLIFQNPTKTQFLSCLRATFIGLFYNLFMPSAIGGDMIKWTSLSNHNLSKKHLLFTVLLDRFIGLAGLVMASILAVTVGYQLKVLQLPQPIIYALTVFTLGVGLGWLILLSASRLLELSWLVRFKYLSQLLKYASVYRKTLVWAFAISVLVQILANFSVYILAHNLGFQSNLLVFFIIEPIVAIITSLPISFAGLGTTEAAALYFFQSVGEASITILAFTTIFTIFRFVFGLMGWVVLTTQRKK